MRVAEVADRLEEVRARIAAAERAAGRAPGSVTLVAVSKRHPPERIREAFLAGQRDFGENYPQELRDKAATLADLPGLRWHAIGPLQTNKAKYVAASAHVFHALDAVDAARELDRRRPPGDVLPCLVSVNVAGEETKHGVAPADLPALLATVRDLRNLQITGLMTLPPWGDPEAARPHFRRLAALATAHGLAQLSIGTTDDYEVAIHEGATMVRVGRSIFGERPTG